MQIEEVIKRHGMEFRDVSRQMGLKPSGLQNAIDRNLTIGTLRKIVDAINAMNEENKRADRCYLAEFFADELPEGFTLTSSATSETVEQSAAVEQPASETLSASATDDLPFDNCQPIPADAPTRSLSASVQGALICPHCHQPFTVEIKG